VRRDRSRASSFNLPYRESIGKKEKAHVQE
jgi:hypothetical protein